MAEQTETVAIGSGRPLDAETASRLRLAFPQVIAMDEEYRPGTWIVIGEFSPQIAVNLEVDIRAQFPDLVIRARLA